MNKDRLILLALLTGVLAVAACDLPWENEKDKKRLPDRAAAANPLLRHYYDMRTMPADMDPIKIPEGDVFDKKELEVKFPMGGSEVVNEVRVRLYLTPPQYAAGSGPDIECKVVAPDGTASAWQEVSFISVSGTEFVINRNAEIIFTTQFDGTLSDGTWKVLLRDPVRDEDGRVSFRNGTLRINGGLPAGSVFGADSDVLALNSLAYNHIWHQESDGRRRRDLSWVGFTTPVRADFTITGSFAVTSFTLSFATRSTFQGDPTTEMALIIISPSGGWYQPSELAWQVEQGPISDGGQLTSDEISTFTISRDRADSFVGDSFPFLGEPSAGTWTVLFWDADENGDRHYLSPKSVVDIAGTLTLVDGVEASLTLG